MTTRRYRAIDTAVLSLQHGSCSIIEDQFYDEDFPAVRERPDMFELFVYSDDWGVEEATARPGQKRVTSGRRKQRGGSK